MSPLQKTPRTVPPEVLLDNRARRAWVILELQLRGHTLADVARAAGVNRQTLYQTFHRSYPRMEACIARAVGLRPEQLFPERYWHDGTTLARKRQRHPATVPAPPSKPRKR
jgi:Ner family transcriptional regulator